MVIGLMQNRWIHYFTLGLNQENMDYKGVTGIELASATQGQIKYY